MTQTLAVTPTDILIDKTRGTERAKRVEALSPSIARRTRRILALQEKGKAKMREMANIIADIGDELTAVKVELDRDKENKTAWMGWLKDHVHYDGRTAQRYMTVARFRREHKKTTTLSFFSQMDPSCLYRVACLPAKCCKDLTPATKLTDPKTGETKPLKEMSARQLDRALDKLEGRQAAPASLPDIETGSKRPAGDDREKFAASVRAAILKLAEDAVRMRSLGGKLKGASKQSAIAASEILRKALLKWPAYAIK